MKQDDMSNIEDFFEDLMGYKPSKAGRAFELIATAAYSIIKGQRAEHDRYIKGESQCVYQVDGLINGEEMLEAKDYTIRKEKVGRPDLQKQEGALIDLPVIKKGIFASATGYTSEAIKYAKGSLDNIKMTGIVTYEIRPSTSLDEQGRIKTINITMHFCYPLFNKGTFSVMFAEGEKEKLCDNIQSKGKQEIETKISISTFYDEKGKKKETMGHLSRSNQPKIESNATEVKGIFPIRAYIKIEGELYGIEGIKYEHVPVVRGTEHFVIESKGDTVLLITSDIDGTDKLITDVELRKAIRRISNK